MEILLMFIIYVNGKCYGVVKNFTLTKRLFIRFFDTEFSEEFPSEYIRSLIVREIVRSFNGQFLMKIKTYTTYETLSYEKYDCWLEYVPFFD
jgi:hypothetical protein